MSLLALAALIALLIACSDTNSSGDSSDSERGGSAGTTFSGKGGVSRGGVSSVGGGVGAGNAVLGGATNGSGSGGQAIALCMGDSKLCSGSIYGCCPGLFCNDLGYCRLTAGGGATGNAGSSSIAASGSGASGGAQAGSAGGTPVTGGTTSVSGAPASGASTGTGGNASVGTGGGIAYTCILEGQSCAAPFQTWCCTGLACVDGYCASSSAVGGASSTGGSNATGGSSPAAGGSLGLGGSMSTGGAPNACPSTTNLITYALQSASGNQIGGDVTLMSDNPCGVLGEIFAYGDDGLDKMSGTADDSVQFPPRDTSGSDPKVRLSPCSATRNGCCIGGKTSTYPTLDGGVDYTASVWGGGIGIPLNDLGSAGTKLAYSGPAKGWNVTISGMLSGQTLRFSYPQSASDICAPFLDRNSVGTLALPFTTSVTCPTSSCTPACIAPTANPYELRVQVIGGDVAGAFDICITSITPIL